MNYEEWETSVPDEITNDSLWKMEAYRLGLFAADVGWYDVTIVDLRINETLQIGAVKNSAYQIWGQSVFLFFEFTIS